MKKLILILTATMLFSCKKEQNPDLQSNSLITVQSDSLLSEEIGDPLIAQDNFFNEFNTAAGTKEKRKVLSKIQYDYDRYVSWKEATNEIKIAGNGITLKFKNDNSGKNEADIYSHIRLSVEKNNSITDTLTVYKQENYAEALVAVTQYFYIDKQLNLWLFAITEDEEGITAQSRKQFKINASTGKIDLIKSQPVTLPQTQNNRAKADAWTGNYFFKRENRDELTTSFSISIKSLDDIDILYVGDAERPETYKKLKAESIGKDKIKIEFNKKYEELGIIYIEKDGSGYIISGEPISNINPGNDDYPLKKTN